MPRLTRRLFIQLAAAATATTGSGETDSEPTEPMSPDVTITHSDGSTESIPETVGWTRQREIGNMRRVTIDVHRDDAQGVTLEPKDDKIALGDIDTVRLVDVEKGGPTWTLVCYSFEWAANEVEPTPGGDLRTGTDQNLITEIVNEVPSWTVGTINSFTGTLAFVFNHAHRHEAIRRIARNMPGEIQFRDEGTVDYVDSLGTDKTASVTLSSANGNIEGEIRITNRGRELDGTHFRVLGAHEGEAQLFANLVPDTDGATYENRVNYTTSRWSSGDTRDWDRWQNKDVSDQATIEEEAAALGQEITEDLVEAKATVVGETLEVGDWVHVSKPEAGLDRDMRVHRIKTRAAGATAVDELLLSTRTTVRQDDSSDLRDIQRFNTAFQGSSVILEGGGSRQPVTGTVNAVESFRYPPVDYEHTVEIEVRGLPYRAYSQGAASVGSHSHGYDWFLIDHNHGVGSNAQTQDDTGSTDVGGGGHTHTYMKPQGSTDSTGGSGSVYAESSTSESGGSHTHDPEPGIIEKFPGHAQADANDELLPSGVDLIVNGTTIASNIGSGEFQTVVDATGDLTRDAWNTIEATSDSIGHVVVTVYAETYKQVGKGN